MNPPNRPADSASLLFAAIPRIVESHLGIANTQSWSALQDLIKTPPSVDQLVSMIEAMFAAIAHMWDIGRANTDRLASRQNWRFVQIDRIGANNSSPEVTLERALARACKSLGRSEWANQVPVASGVLDARSHKRAAIDLVQRCDPDCYEFVELKVGSDTPLHAALEIIRYGMIWILSRRDKRALGYGDNPVLNAKSVRLLVLAPTRYYRGLELSHLADSLNRAISLIGAREADAAMSFEFQDFPAGFKWPAELAANELCAAFDGRRRWSVPAEERSMCEAVFLPGVPEALIRAAYNAAPGNEIDSGKFASPESSAALVANAFGYFLERPEELPPLLAPMDLGWPPDSLALESIVRFPWVGGRHPRLDVLISTRTTLLGIESKRYEPFRSKQKVELSTAYWRAVWGTEMCGYERVRDGLRDGSLAFARLDAAQLVKHAFGLRTELHRRQASGLKQAVLLYLYAEPQAWPDGRLISRAEHTAHRAEIARFAEMVANDEVVFCACSYGDLLAKWSASPDSAVRGHATELTALFHL